MSPFVCALIDAKLKELDKLNTNSAIKRIATSSLSCLGYNSWAFACENPDSIIGTSHLSTGIPFQWFAMYLAKRYQNVDPIVTHCRRFEEPILWDAVNGWDTADDNVRDFMRNIHASGFGSGMAIPLRSPSGAKGILSLVNAKPLADLRESYLENMESARAIGMAVYSAVERIRLK